MTSDGNSSPGPLVQVN